MKRHRTILVAVIAILITTTTGCKDDDQRLVEMAERHEERQAEQTRLAIQLQQELRREPVSSLRPTAKLGKNSSLCSVTCRQNGAV